MPIVNDVVEYRQWVAGSQVSYGIVTSLHTSKTGNPYAVIRFIGNKGLSKKPYTYEIHRLKAVYNITRDLVSLLDPRETHDLEISRG